MLADEIYQRLQGLQLFGMAALCDELLGHRERPLPPPEQWLRRMIEAEESERQCRSIRYKMGIAKFPLARDLDSFDTRNSPVSPEQLRALDRNEFLAALLIKSKSWIVAPTRQVGLVDRLPNRHTKSYDFVHDFDACQDLTHLGVVAPQAQFRPDELLEAIHRGLG